MPWLEVYRLRQPGPLRIQYRDAAVLIEIVYSREEIVEQWRLRARRIDDPTKHVDLARAFTRQDLERKLYSDGFYPGPDSSSPERRIADFLVSRGWAAKQRVKYDKKQRP